MYKIKLNFNGVSLITFMTMENNRLKKVIVPWDFTEVAENALKYAFAMSDNSNSQFEIVHVHIKGGIFSSKSSDELQRLQTSLEDEKNRIKKVYKIDVKTVILEGKLFDAISDYASETDASLVVMGTHGMVGMQKIIGSKALKVIDGSNTPFIVVQEEPKTKDLFQNIIFPVDYRKEIKEMLSWALNLNRLYGSRIHIVKQHQTDPGMKRKVDNNITFCKNYFELHDIPFDIHIVPKTGHFHKEIIFQAKNIKSDLIFILTTKNIDFGDYLMGAQEQHIIANDFKIPVLCINPHMV